jgi:transcription elongation GreA/GreB family factor
MSRHEKMRSRHIFLFPESNRWYFLRNLKPYLTPEHTMNKEKLLAQIVTRLENDYKLLQVAASAQAEADHEQDSSDNLCDAPDLEAFRQQEARREELQQSLATFRQLTVQNFDDATPIHLTALVALVDVRGRGRQVFIGPAAGGLRIRSERGEVMVVTPASSLGRQLIGRQCGDLIELAGATAMEYEIVSVC